MWSFVFLLHFLLHFSLGPYLLFLGFGIVDSVR
jgi:hypothetical protein